MLLTEDVAHGVTDFSQGSVGLDGGNNEGEKISCTGCALFQGSQRLLYQLIVAPLAQVSQFGNLAFAYRGINAQQVWMRFIL